MHPSGALGVSARYQGSAGAARPPGTGQAHSPVTLTPRLAPGDPRRRFPRFRDENHARNLELLAALEAIAERKGGGATAAQLAIAWVASRGEDIIPLIGTKRRDRLAEALKALDLTLSADELAAIEAAVPAGAVAGDRYDPSQMAALDSER
jgi:aryl-alcohol dehydrogenase-like predicted oxidoreductase